MVIGRVVDVDECRDGGGLGEPVALDQPGRRQEQGRIKGVEASSTDLCRGSVAALYPTTTPPRRHTWRR